LILRDQKQEFAGTYNKLMVMPYLGRKNGVSGRKIRNQLPVAKKHKRRPLPFDGFRLVFGN
jgi:hypothetical protein